MDNQIDLGSMYGILDTPVNSDRLNRNIPSLSEIARFNYENARQNNSNMQSTSTTNSIPANNRNYNMPGACRSNPPVYGVDTNISTPTTAINTNGGSPEEIVGEMTTTDIVAEVGNSNTFYPINDESIQYMNGFLRTQIGRRVEVEFLVGADTLQTKTGYLLAVGINFILINETDTNDITACDFYNVKFVRIYY